jgi:hypothetical protein
MGQGHVVTETTSWARSWKPSLLVVLGNGPVYNQANDVRFNRHVQFFVHQEIATYQRSWQTLPFGNTGGTPTDVQRIQNAKYFDPYQEFVQTYRPSPRSVTDWTQGNADIFHGFDTYGWPPDPVPIFWNPPFAGTSVVLNSFPPYNATNDVVIMHRQDKTFGEYQSYFTGSPLLPRSVLDTYITYLDRTIVRSNAKWFPEIGALDYWRISQAGTANILNFFPIYNPATDVIFRLPQAKFFDEYQSYFRGQTITRNILENLPPPFDFRTMFFFRRSDNTFPPYIDYPVDFFQKFSFEVIVNQLVPPPPPPPLPGQIILPSFLGLSWYEASWDIIQLGLIQNQPPILVQTGVYPPGTVVGQYPNAGVAVSLLTDIILTVEVDNLLGASFDLNLQEFPY